MDHFIGVWWSGSDDDARGGGTAAKGYLALNFSGLGANYPAIQDIKKYVVDKGKSQVEKDKFADNFYNRGVFNTVLVAEAIRNAQKLTGKKVVTAPDVRRGLETLQHHRRRAGRSSASRTSARPMHVTCTDHNGHSPAYYAAVGRQAVAQGLRLDRADEGKGRCRCWMRRPPTTSRRTPAGRSAPRLATRRRELT